MTLCLALDGVLAISCHGDREAWRRTPTIMGPLGDASNWAADAGGAMPSVLYSKLMSVPPTSPYSPWCTYVDATLEFYCNHLLSCGNLSMLRVCAVLLSSSLLLL